MLYLLNDHIALRGWRDRPHAIVSFNTGRVRFLTQPEWLLLSFCNGQTDLSLYQIVPGQKEMLARAEAAGIIRPPRAREAITTAQSYHFFDNVYMERVHWSITGRCNYRCRHCFLSAPSAQLGEFSTSECLDIIGQLSDCGVTQVNLTGGEPLLRQDFFTLVDALLEKHIHIRQIYSNGSLVDQRLLKGLADRGITCEFNISFDGVNHHDWLRGIPGAEAAALAAFDCCRSLGFPTGAEMCIHRRNRESIGETVRLLADHGVNNLKIIPVSAAGEWLAQGAGEQLDIEEVCQTYLSYIPEYFRDGAPLSIMLGGFFQCDAHSRNWSIPALRHCGTGAAGTDRVCESARNMLYIAADGRILPCMPMSGIPEQAEYPRLADLSIPEALTDSVYLHRVEATVDDLLAHNEECRACPHRYRCGGGCRAGALIQGQGFYGRDPAICHIFRHGYIEKIHGVCTD